MIQSFNTTIDTWLGFLNDYKLEDLHRQPKPGSWSLGQMYLHIINDTRYFVEQMREALLAGDANSEKDMHEDAKSMFAQNSFPEVMIEGPATGIFIPQPDSVEQLKNNLLEIKEEVNRLYREFDFPTSKGKTLHPALLYFSASQWMQFADMHMRHHFRQKKRIDNMLH